MKNKVSLCPIAPQDREAFIAGVQAAFDVSVRETFGPDAGEAIPRRDVESSLDAPGAETYHILCDGVRVGGVALVIDPERRHGSLDLLFIHPSAHGGGLGLAAWEAVERLHPEVALWETHTPYFEKRNIPARMCPAGSTFSALKSACGKKEEAVRLFFLYCAFF